MTAADRLQHAEGEFGDVRFPDRFQVERVIGRGGTGVVFAAFDQRLHRRVALKVLRAGTDGAGVDVLAHGEARTLASLAHPHLIAVYDTFFTRSHRGEPNAFLVLELVDGPDMHQYLRGMRLTVAQVAQIGAQLCSALAYVHERGYLHQDVKPSNVLLSFQADQQVQAKLSDFGTAAVLQGQLQQGEFTVGTAAYLSPEQAEGSPLTAASDVYALGLVLLEAATGQVAFTGSVLESALARLDDDPVVPTGLPGGLREVLIGMTHRSPTSRLDLQTATQRLLQLQRVLAGEVATAVPSATSAPPPAPALQQPRSAAPGPQGSAETSQVFVPQEEELTLLLELAVLTLGGSAAALIEHDGRQYRHRAGHDLPELLTLTLRQDLVREPAAGVSAFSSDEHRYLVTAVGSAEPTRYLIVRLPDGAFEHAPPTHAVTATATVLAAAIDSALRLRDAVRRALFAR